MYMIISKKGLQSHMLIIILVSAILTFLVIGILAPLFVVDPAKCQSYKYEIVSKCKADSTLEIEIKNVADNIIGINVNDVVEETLVIGESKVIRFYNKNDKIFIIPFFKEALSDEIFQCKSQKENIDVRRVKNC